jgi:two-component system LytT family response regulator
MTTFRALIVDDEFKAREILKSLILRNCPEVQISGEASSVEEALAHMDKHEIDLLFLDIEMPYENGFALIDKMDKKDLHVVFTTAYNHFAIRAIRYSAFDYLLKPVDVDELKATIARLVALPKPEHQDQKRMEGLMQQIRNGSKLSRIALPTLEGLLMVEISDIVWIEASENYSNLYLTDKRRICVSRIIKDFEEMLVPENFCRVHHGSMVNLSHVSRYVKGDGGYVVMDDGTSVEVSRRKKQEFLQALTMSR